MIILLLLSLSLSAPPGVNIPMIIKEAPLNNYEAIWEAVCKVESNGNPDAFCIDINGQPSVGIAQIQTSRIKHYNRLTGKDYKLYDCFSSEVSKEVFMHFAYIHKNEEKLIRSWNGSGAMTVIYYNKVKRYL